MCSVSGETASLLSVGTCTIAADQAGDAEWLAAATVSQTFQVLAAPKKEQTIAFPAIADRVLGSGDVALEAMASSDLAVSYTSTTPAVCAVSGETASLLAVGTCTITADQSAMRVARGRDGVPDLRGRAGGDERVRDVVGEPVVPGQTSALHCAGRVRRRGPRRAVPPPTGTVTLFDGGSEIGSATLGPDASASIKVAGLAAGSHAITARYAGDAGHAPSVSDVLLQTVRGPGSVVLAVSSGDRDARFTFTGSDRRLTVAVETRGGQGETAPVVLPPGRYEVRLDDARRSGFVLADVACTGASSSTDPATGRASFDLDAEAAVRCAFTALDAATDMGEAARSFMAMRANIILAHLPDQDRRLARLRGEASAGGDPLRSFLSDIPQYAQGSPVHVSGSLAALEALNESPGSIAAGSPRFDVWFDATADSSTARPGTATSPSPRRARTTGSATSCCSAPSRSTTASGRATTTADRRPAPAGSLAPNATVRLSENLYLDALAAGGHRHQHGQPGRHGRRRLRLDPPDGERGRGRRLAVRPVDLRPDARFSWYREWADSFTDDRGVTVDALSVNYGQLSAGPNVAYAFEFGRRLHGPRSLDLEAVWTIFGDEEDDGFGDVRGRAKVGVDVATPSGVRVGASVGYDGIGASDASALSANIRLSIPMP